MVATINTRWFQGKLADRGMSQRALARHMRLDPGAMSLMLRGKRKMSVAEATAIAKFLRVPVEEVVAKAGALPSMIGRTDDPWGGEREKAEKALREVGSRAERPRDGGVATGSGAGELVVPLPGGRRAVVALPEDVSGADVDRIVGVLRGFVG